MTATNLGGTMSFGDEDLKRLKEWIKNPIFNYGSPEKIEALLARLEAAEWVVSEVERAQRHGNVSDDFIECVKAWRKSVGRPHD